VRVPDGAGGGPRRAAGGVGWGGRGDRQPGEWVLGWGLEPNSFGAIPVGSGAVVDVLNGWPALSGQNGSFPPYHGPNGARVARPPNLLGRYVGCMTTVHLPYTVEQDEDGVWSAHAWLGSSGGANGNGEPPRKPSPTCARQC